MKLNERKKVAIALGYYARAVGEIKTLADAIAAYALDEYRNDIDCQVGFRKGYQEAEEHLAKNGQEARELRELVGWIARLEQQVHEQRRDILEYLKRQELLTQPLVYGGPGGGAAWHTGAGIASGGGGGAGGEVKYTGYGRGGGGGGGGGLAGAFGENAEWESPSGGTGGSGGRIDPRGPVDETGDYIAVTGPDGRIIEIGGGGGGGENILDGPFQMRRVDNGELFCQDGKPVVHQGYQACVEACNYLYANMGIHCAPLAGRPLGKEWNPPTLEFKKSPERQRYIERWYARMEDDLRKQHEE